ncbi:hypothetical protein Tco_0183308 [Tanacetum coccineum]
MTERGEYNRRVAPILTLNSLTKHPKEIQATETQMRLLSPRPMLNLLRSGNTDRYCDYHQEKGHYTNECIQLRKQLEMALESGKLNHVVKDVWQTGRGSHGRDKPQPAKIINVISVNSVKDKKRKVRETTEWWMNIPISFPAISYKDIFEEPLIVEVGVEGYLVRRVYVDEGSSVEVMFEHYFENLNPKIKARLKETQTDLVGFATEISKPLGVATLVTQTVIIADCRRLEKKQMIKEESPEGKREVATTEEVLVNPSFPYQQVTIRGGLHATSGYITHVERESFFGSCMPKAENTFDGEKRGACPKDYYPLPNIDCKVESVMGFRPVDSTFQSQIGRNLEAYVDDMVIKSKDEKMLLADIAETFDNLKKIYMNLNPKKCSFGVEEGKFLGYMLTSERIRANPKKTKALANIQSLRTLKDMQRLSGKLAALNRFLAKSAERSLPFFNTLKSITKENKQEYR